MQDPLATRKRVIYAHTVGYKHVPSVGGSHSDTIVYDINCARASGPHGTSHYREDREALPPGPAAAIVVHRFFGEKPVEGSRSSVAGITLALVSGMDADPRQRKG